MSAPILLAPRPVPRPWGGDGLPRYHLAAPAGTIVGEWWLPTDGIDLLVKVIDARQNLSIQLHPDDDCAATMGLPCGKTEAWYVLDARPDARILLGLRPGADPADCLARAERGDDLSPFLDMITPHPGDVLYVPPGTLHAIGAGVVVLEVQQVSDTTFRVFDWNRVPRRPLHLAEARRAVRSGSGAGRIPPGEPEREGGLVRHLRLVCPKFVLSELEVLREAAVPLAEDRAELWFAVEGAGTVRTAGGVAEVCTGSFCRLEKGTGSARVRPTAGSLRLLRIHAP